MEYAARLLVFDLDGTLVDSKEDLANAVNVAIESFDLPPLPHPVIYSYVGDGASALMRRALPKEKADALPEVLDRFLAYYRRHLLDTTRAYPGVIESLRKWAGIYRMAVLTNKGVTMSREILSGLSLDGYFFEVIGGDSFRTKKPDPEGLLHILREAGVEAADAIMIGDSANDVQAEEIVALKSNNIGAGVAVDRRHGTGYDGRSGGSHQAGGCCSPCCPCPRLSWR